MILLSEALAIIDRETSPLPPESVELSDAAGRFLAVDVIADHDMPPFDRSQMDGFAVLAQDTRRAPAELKVAGESAAGRGWHKTLNSGEAVRIMTGAPVPPGSDAVQKLELTAETSENASASTVTILESVEAGKFVVRRGTEAKCGSVILQAGERVSPKMVAVAAAFGYARIDAFCRPRVSILSTGSEIVPITEKPSADQIRDSNSPMLAALAREAGGLVTTLPLARDHRGELSAAIESTHDADVLIVTGGVSVSKYDLTKDVLVSLGAEIFFDRVRLKPGKPAVFARLGRQLVFALPGNPVSAAVTYYLFARRALYLLQGSANAGLPKSFAVAAHRLKGAAERDAMLPASLETDGGGKLKATALKSQGSSDFVGFSRADALVFVPAGETIEPDQRVEAFKL